MKQLKRWCSLGAVLSLGILLSSCIESPMSTIDTVTEWGRDINSLYLLTTIIVSVVFVAVAVPFCYAMWRFREREGDESIPKQVHGNHLLEILWTVIPIILLIFIFMPSLELILKQHEAPPADALKVKAIGHQWWWEFQYPELGITTANELYVPEDRELVVELTSADVIHSFWIPRWGGKVDNLPGETNIINYRTPPVENAETGDYYWGHCAELCGLSHARMRFQAVVLPKERFEKWAEAHNQPPVVASALEKKGQELFMQKTCFTCHAIEGTMAKGLVGPSLTNFGNRKLLAAGTLENDREGLYKWIRDSIDSKQDEQSIKPGSLMVFGEGYELTDEEIEALTAYLHRSTAKVY